MGQNQERRNCRAIFRTMDKVTPTLFGRWPVTMAGNGVGACEKNLKHGQTSFNSGNERTRSTEATIAKTFRQHDVRLLCKARLSAGIVSPPTVRGSSVHG